MMARYYHIQMPQNRLIEYRDFVDSSFCQLCYRKQILIDAKFQIVKGESRFFKTSRAT